MLRKHFHHALAFAAAAGPVLSPSLGQVASSPNIASEATRPSAAGRVVRLFTFEERDSNPNPVPRFWTRNQDQADRPRPGFPRFNPIELDELQDEPAATRGCVRLSTRGGSTSLLLDGGVIPVFKDADYLVGGRVRTEGLEHARAALAVRFLDEKLQPIEASEHISEPVLSEHRWTSLSVPIRGDFPSAAFVQFELLLLQPDQLLDRSQGARVSARTEVSPQTDSKLAAPRTLDSSIELRRQDLSGSAYFDDVSIVQLPRLELTTQSITNIIAAPEVPSIQLLVRDLTGEALAGKLLLLDAAGRTVDTRALSIGEGRSRTNWNPALPGYGWYRAVLDMSNSMSRVGATYLDFAWLPPRPEAAPGYAFSASSTPRFWLLSRDVPAASYSSLANVCRDMRADGLSIPVWTHDLTNALVPARSGALRPLVDSFRSERLDLAFSLPIVPGSATDPKAIVAPDPWSLMISQPAVVRPLLDEFLDAYGQTVQRWQVGWFSSRAIPAPAAFQSGLDTIESMLSKLVPGPIVVVPTSLEDLAAASSVPGFEPAVFMPHDALPASCALAVDAWKDRAIPAARGSRRLLAALGSAPDRQFDASDAAASLAKRAVRVWASATASREKAASRDTVGIALADPWAVRGDRVPQLMPRPELAAWRAIIDRLANRAFVCEFPMPGSGEAYLFADRSGAPHSGLLVLWNDASLPDQVKLQNYLGSGPIESVDVFGNRSTLNDPSHAPIAISSSPVFIEGVDAELLHFVARFSIDPPLLSMTSPETQHNIQVTNTWPVPISGTLQLLEPGGVGPSVRRDRTWRINPRTFAFALAPGETASLPMSVSFGTAEEVGTKPFVFNVELAAGHSYEPFRVAARMELGLRDISFSVTATPRGNDVVLEATISNQSRTPLTLAMTAFPPEMPRQLVDVGEVMPGNQVIHRFTLRNVYPGHKGQRIPVAIADSEAGIRINRSVVIP